MKSHYLTTAGLGALLAVSGAHGLEIDPQVLPEVNIGGRLIATLNYLNDDQESDTELDVADSSLLFGFSKYLFKDSNYGFASFGFKLPEDENHLKDDVFVHQAFVGIGGLRYEVKLGRSNLTNTLVRFPTLRDDDLLGFTHVPNGHSNSEAEEYVIFGNVAQARWWFSDRLGMTAALTARTETDDHGDRETTSEFNGGSLGLAYDVPESIKFDRGLRFAGLSLDYQDLDGMVLGHGETARNLQGDEMLSLIAALTVNLSDDPERTWVLDGQGIYNGGSDVDSLGSFVERARAESLTVVGAVRYLHRPYLQTRWEAALTLGWKNYSDFDDTGAFTVAPTFAYRLGSGVNLLAQYRYRHNDDGLADLLGEEDQHVVAVGLSFSFDYTLNETVGERGSILQLEHNMFDIGPVGGGH